MATERTEECEWNPSEDRPAYDTDHPHAKTSWSVGVKPNWHLCDNCAKLPRFAKFTKRKQIH